MGEIIEVAGFLKNFLLAAVVGAIGGAVYWTIASYVQEKKIERCVKCGDDVYSCKKYNQNTDMLQRHCLHCGYRWEELPRDKKKRMGMK